MYKCNESEETNGLFLTVDITFAENYKLPKLCFSLSKLRTSCRRFAQ